MKMCFDVVSIEDEYANNCLLSVDDMRIALKNPVDSCYQTGRYLNKKVILGYTGSTSVIGVLGAGSDVRWVDEK